MVLITSETEKELRERVSWMYRGSADDMENYKPVSKASSIEEIHAAEQAKTYLVSTMITVNAAKCAKIERDGYE